MCVSDNGHELFTNLSYQNEIFSDTLAHSQHRPLTAQFTFLEKEVSCKHSTALSPQQLGLYQIILHGAWYV